MRWELLTMIMVQGENVNIKTERRGRPRCCFKGETVWCKKGEKWRNMLNHKGGKIGWKNCFVSQVIIKYSNIIISCIYTMNVFLPRKRAFFTELGFGLTIQKMTTFSCDILLVNPSTVSFTVRRDINRY